MLFNQECKCCICKKEINLKNKTAVIDHNHITGKVRGLLCYSCNTGIGLFKDNVNTLNAAINYINLTNS